MSAESEIRRRLEVLNPLRIELTDESAAHAGHAGARPGGNTHWRLRIVSASFAGQSAPARHRMVYNALGDLMSTTIHALSIRAETPDESSV